MCKKNKILVLIIVFLIILKPAFSNENFFLDAEKKYNEKKYDTSKFLFQRNLVFNPKDAKSYLYLAKIYNNEENEKEEEKNLKTTLLLEPNNEEALLMIMKIGLKRSNYSQVKEFNKTFSNVCEKLCDKSKEILESLKNIEPKNDS
jgi:tetratricopeptide (TPR) repeat protein